MDPEKREVFLKAFTVDRGRGQNVCHCGKSYYYDDGHMDWDKEEYDRFESQDAVQLPYSIGILVIEGNEYVDDCDCWTPHAERFATLIDLHDRQIARYLHNEKERKKKVARRAPTVENPDGN